MICLKKFILISTFVIVALIFIVYNNSNSLNDRADVQLLNKTPSYVNHTLAENQILIYTKYYNDEWNDIFTGEPLFKNNRCIYTTDPNDLMTSSYVIFHLRDVTKDSDLPAVKVTNQKWIIYNIESAIVNQRYDAYQLYRNIGSLFDLTMTYRMDSDIPIPYGRVVAFGSNDSRSDVNLEINFNEKVKGIAWFVSNCASFSKREIVVRKMRKFIPIDVYGHCGKLKCPIVNDRLYKNESCYEMLSKNYKFYLAFENSICIDYVTEKLFNILSYDVIPIVFGGANYSNILPYNSYIDVMNFTSAEKLVRYVEYVGNNETIFKSYFEWRKDFHVVTNFPDKLCDFLLDEFHGDGNGKFFDWWFDGTTCRNVTVW